MQHNHYICEKWEHYLDIYDHTIASYKLNYQNIHLLEIGTGFGGSLELWKEYFGTQGYVSGIWADKRMCENPLFVNDIDIDCFDILSDTEKRISFFSYHTFDIIIGDNSQEYKDVLSTFE